MLDKPVLVLSLGVRGGTVIYGKEIIDRLKIEKEVIVSSKSEVPVPKYQNKWLTHTNPIELFVFSAVILPYYMIVILLSLFNDKYSALYLPYLHFWSIFFIIIFKMFHKRVIITDHDGMMHNKDQIKYIVQNITNICRYFANDSIYLTSSVRQEVEKKKWFKANAHTVPHGLIIPRGLNSRPRKYPLYPNILFFGRVLRSKGIDLLMEAMAEIDTLKYNKIIVAGKNYHNFSIKIPDEKIIVVNEFIPENQVSKYFNEADILVLPYRQASQSGVVTIGIASCIPMVCTNVGGLVEQLEKDEAVFVMDNVTSVLEGLLRLLDDEQLYESISLNLYKKKNSLSWDFIANEVGNIIYSVK